MLLNPQIIFQALFCLPVFLRSETKLWSPLSSEEGKTHPYKMNLASEPRVCVSIKAVWTLTKWLLQLCHLEWNRVAVQFLEARVLPSPSLCRHGDFFFFLNLYPTTVHDEVIVYLPTGGFLGDSSLSAKPWRKPQFLPAEWKVEAKVWIHVGNGVSGPVCVCVSQVTKLEFCFFCFSHTHINTYFKHFSRICCFTLLFYVSIVSSFAQVILLAETRGDFALLEAWSMSYIWRHFRVPTVKHELDLVVFVCPLWWHASVMTHLSLKLAT